MNLRAYYSGHYEHYGPNCQGMCDSSLCFLYFGIVAPGSVNNNITYTRTGSLSEVIENLNLGEFDVGNAAYTPTEHLLILFTGSQQDYPENNVFNFYLIQLRIHIEMAFSLLVNKFRILKTPLTRSMHANSRIIMTCAILHNFIIDTDSQDELEEPTNAIIDPDNIQQVNGETFDAINNAHVGMMYRPSMREEDFVEINGVSNTKRVLVEWLKNNNYTQPEYNMLRNSRWRNTAIYDNRNEFGYDEQYYHPV